MARGSLRNSKPFDCSSEILRSFEKWKPIDELRIDF